MLYICKLSNKFDLNRTIPVSHIVRLFPLKWICWIHFLPFFSSWHCQLGVLNKDSIVWLGSARLYNTCIQPYVSEEVLTQPRHVLTPKIHLQVWKISKIWQNHFLKNQKENLTNTLLATGNLSNPKFGILMSPMNSIYKILLKILLLLLFIYILYIFQYKIVIFLLQIVSTREVLLNGMAE